MSKLHKLQAILGVGIIFASVSAQAADYDNAPVMEEVVPAYSPPEQTFVEFGTGWYLRGDIAVTSNKLNIGINAGSWTNEQRDLGYAASIGFGGGYQLGKHARFEVGIERFFGLQAGERNLASCSTLGVTGTCYRGGNVELAATTFLVSAFYDIAELWGVTPYIGAGIGTSLLNWSSFSAVDSCVGAIITDCAGNGAGNFVLNSQNYNTNSEWRLAYSLSAGIGYKLTKNVSLDVGYRLTGIAGGAFYDATRAAGATTATFSTSPLNIHQVKVGVRYAIW